MVTWIFKNAKLVYSIILISLLLKVTPCEYVTLKTRLNRQFPNTYLSASTLHRNIAHQLQYTQAHDNFNIITIVIKSQLDPKSRAANCVYFHNTQHQNEKKIQHISRSPRCGSRSFVGPQNEPTASHHTDCIAIHI